MTKLFKVQANTIEWGPYEAENEQQARDLCAQDAGYKSEAHMVEQLEQPSELQAHPLLGFLETANSRETSIEIIEAIWHLAGNETKALRIWQDPTPEERLAIWERVTKNGLIDQREFVWGSCGSDW